MPTSRLHTTVLCLALASCSAASITEDTGDAHAEELKLSATASSSSNETATLSPDKAVDGNAATRWSSAFADPQWIRLDLGSKKSINRVVLNWEAAYSKSYEIQVSDDGSTFTPIYSDTNGNGGIDDIALSASGRYVRMYSKTRGTAWGNSLWEFEVHGPDTTSSEQMLTRSGSAVASSLEAATLPANNAVDGNGASRWASAYSDAQWIYQDLGGLFTVSRVKLSWEAAYGRDYELQTSSDGNAWTTIKSVTGGDGGVDEYSGLNQQARYVRMNGKKRGTAWGYSLWEFQVYGSGSTTTPPNTSTPTIQSQFTSGSGWSVRKQANASVNFGVAGGEDGAVAQLVFPGNAALGANDLGGPDYATEIVQQTGVHFGTYRTRLSLARCSSGEEVVNGVFTYSRGGDTNGNGITDNNEIDIEILCGEPHMILLSSWTDFDNDSSFRRWARGIDTRTGDYSEAIGAGVYGLGPVIGNVPGAKKPGFPVAGAFYEMGFDWYSDHIRWFIVFDGVEVTLWDFRDKSLIPQNASSFLFNVWHAPTHWFSGGAADYPAAAATMTVDWFKYWKAP
jgi:hypothetical protein